MSSLATILNAPARKAIKMRFSSNARLMMDTDK